MQVLIFGEERGNTDLALVYKPTGGGDLPGLLARNIPFSTEGFLPGTPDAVVVSQAGIERRILV